MPVSKEERIKMGLVGKKTYKTESGKTIEIDWDDEENSSLLTGEEAERVTNPKMGRVRKLLSDGTEILEEKEFKIID